MGAIVVVGGGQGGFSTVEALRQHGHDGRIVLVDALDRLPHRRTPLSKAYLAGDADADSLTFRPASFYESIDVDLELGVRAVGIDHAQRRLQLDDARSMRYEHLVLAPGSAPRAWRGPGAELEGVLSLHAVPDADRLRAALERASTVVVVGGGFIGLEVGSYAAGQGKRVTVLESAPRVMARGLSREASEVLLRRHRAKGVDVRLAVDVAGIEGRGGRAVGVRLSTDELVPADLVIVSVGSAAVTSPLGARFVDDRLGAIRVDGMLRTDDPSISAVGDAVAFPRAGGSIRLESVQNATDQARAVAARLTGDASEYAAVPWFWTEQAGVKLQMAGLMSEADRVIVRGDETSDRFSLIGFRERELVGAESFGRPSDHIAVRSLLASGLALHPDQAGDDGFDMMAHARTAAGPREGVRSPRALA